jgi:hypothetical protein
VGAPGFPPVAGRTLLAAALASAIPIALVVLLGRGVRDAGGSYDRTILRQARPGWRVVELARKLRPPAERLYMGIAAASLLEVAAVWSIVRLVIRAGRRGFL